MKVGPAEELCEFFFANWIWLQIECYISGGDGKPGPRSNEIWPKQISTFLKWSNCTKIWEDFSSSPCCRDPTLGYAMYAGEAELSLALKILLIKPRMEMKIPKKQCCVDVKLLIPEKSNLGVQSTTHIFEKKVLG